MTHRPIACQTSARPGQLQQVSSLALKPLS